MKKFLINFPEILIKPEIENLGQLLLSGQSYWNSLFIAISNME